MTTHIQKQVDKKLTLTHNTLVWVEDRCEDRLEKSVPQDHRLSSFDKPRDAKRRSSGRIFLYLTSRVMPNSDPRHGFFLYPTLTLMIDIIRKQLDKGGPYGRL